MRLRALIEASGALLLAGLFLTASQAAGIDGRWSGKVDRIEWEFTLDLRTDAQGMSALLSIPSQGVDQVALQEVSFDGRSLAFVIPNPNDDPIRVTAELQEDGSFTGSYQLGAQSGTFSMKRGSSR